MEIKYEYTNSSGEKFTNLKNIHFDSIRDFESNIGQLVFQTSGKAKIFLTSKNDAEGSYIYLSSCNKYIAYKVSKNYRLRRKVVDLGPPMTDRLIAVIEKINLTDFPTGIITIKDFVIGQEMIYYHNYRTLTTAVYQRISEDKLLYYYQKILLIIQELLDNGIIYIDIHPNNIMVNSNNNQVKLIDFDPEFISFNQDNESYYQMLNNLKKMIDEINTYLKLSLDTKNTSSLEDISREIIKKRILIKKEG